MELPKKSSGAHKLTFPLKTFANNDVIVPIFSDLIWHRNNPKPTLSHDGESNRRPSSSLYQERQDFKSYP